MCAVLWVTYSTDKIHLLPLPAKDDVAFCSFFFIYRAGQADSPDVLTALAVRGSKKGIIAVEPVF